MIFIFNSSRLPSACKWVIRMPFLSYKLIVAIPAILLVLFPSLIFGAAPTSQSTGAMQKNIAPDTEPVVLTQQQWNDLFTDYAKQIVSLQTQFDYYCKHFVSNAQAQDMENRLKSYFPQGHFHVSAGYQESNSLVKLRWIIATGLLNGEEIQVAKGLNSSGESNAAQAFVQICVVGPQTVWQAYPNGETWSVAIHKRQDQERQQAWLLAVTGTYALDVLRNIWTPFDVILTKYHLIEQSYDKSTGLIKLTYVPFSQFISKSLIGQIEFICEVKLDGGLRIYHASLVAVGGPGGQLNLLQDADFGGFEKSNGIWFPTSIHLRWWEQNGDPPPRTVPMFKLDFSVPGAGGA